MLDSTGAFYVHGYWQLNMQTKWSKEFMDGIDHMVEWIGAVVRPQSTLSNIKMFKMYANKLLLLK